jgi:aminoglycoside 3-N-acetyltransferase
MPGAMYEWMVSQEAFDAAKTKSRMGAFTEHIRSSPGAKRSAHPTHSVVAIGPRAVQYVAEHHEDVTPAGPLSPFSKHMQNGGQILCLGTGVGKITSYHVVEDIMEDFPVRPYLDVPMTKAVVFENGESRVVETRVHNPRLGPWRVDNFKPKEDEIRRLLLARGVLREGRVGAARASLIDAAGLLTCLKEWARNGTTIYHHPMLSYR